MKMNLETYSITITHEEIDIYGHKIMLDPPINEFVIVPKITDKGNDIDMEHTNKLPFLKIHSIQDLVDKALYKAIELIANGRL